MESSQQNVGQTLKSIQLIKHTDRLKLPSGVPLFSFVHCLCFFKVLQFAFFSTLMTINYAIYTVLWQFINFKERKEIPIQKGNLLFVLFIEAVKTGGLPLLAWE